MYIVVGNSEESCCCLFQNAIFLCGVETSMVLQVTSCFLPSCWFVQPARLVSQAWCDIGQGVHPTLDPAVTLYGLDPAVTLYGLDPAVTLYGLDPAVTSYGLMQQAGMTCALAAHSWHNCSTRQVWSLPVEQWTCRTCTAGVHHDMSRNMNRRVENHVLLFKALPALAASLRP
jgi:hypothetical protein